jgi:hypothetical protein
MRSRKRKADWGSKVINLMNLEVDRIGDIMVKEFKIGVANPVLNVPFPSSKEVIHNNDLPS